MALPPDWKLTIKREPGDAHFDFEVRLEGCSEGHDLLYSGTVKWDACTHFYSHHEGEGDPEYLHVCGQHREIAALMLALREEGLRQFPKPHEREQWK